MTSNSAFAGRISVDKSDSPGAVQLQLVRIAGFGFRPNDEASVSLARRHRIRGELTFCVDVGLLSY